jgi:hypothetical protein
VPLYDTTKDRRGTGTLLQCIRTRQQQQSKINNNNNKAKSSMTGTKSPCEQLLCTVEYYKGWVNQERDWDPSAT